MRLERAISNQPPASRRRIEAALAGDLELRHLDAKEGAIFNAEIAAAIEGSLIETNYGAILAERGVSTVALDADGEIVEHHPDAQ